MILEQFSVSHPMCYSLSQSDLWYWNRKCYPHNVLLTFSIRSMILELEIVYPHNVLLTFSIRSMILEQEMLSRQCVTHFLNQIYDTGTGNVIQTMLLTFSISMILEQEMLSNNGYSLSQSDLWYWNRSVLHNVLLTFSIRSMILEDLWYWNRKCYPDNVLRATQQALQVWQVQPVQPDLWYWNRKCYQTMCYSLSQSDLWYWNRKCYLDNVLLTFSIRSMILEQEMLSRQCVTHFLNQIYDTGRIIQHLNVLLTFYRSMILEQKNCPAQCVTHFVQSDLYQKNYPAPVLLTFSTRSMILEQEMLSRQCVTHFLKCCIFVVWLLTRSMILEQEMLSRQCMKRSRPTATNTMRRPLTPRMTWCWMMATFGTCDPTSSSTSLTSSTSTPVDVSTREALRWSSTLRLYPLPAPLIGHSCLPLYPLPEELSSTSYRSLLFTIVSFTRRIVQHLL